MAKTKFKQYIMRPSEPQKYIGVQPIICRSSWEFKFALWCDTNPNILQWSSESIIIPYISPIDNKMHKYFADNYIVYRNKEGKIKKYLVEIKPEKQTMAPKKTKKKKESSLLYEQATWEVNKAKWDAATNYAKQHGWEFIILTEKDLNIS